MSFTETSRRLTRWRLGLAEYDLTLQYCPGCVHQVPDALSLPIFPRVYEDLPPLVDVDDQNTTFDAKTTVRDVSNELGGHVCTVSCNHDFEHVVVPTSIQAERQKKSRAQARAEPGGENEAPALDGTFWDEKDEFDAAEVERTQDSEFGVPNTEIVPPQNDLPAPPTIE